MARRLAALIALSLFTAACGGSDDATPDPGDVEIETDDTTDTSESSGDSATTAPVVIEEGPKAPFTGLLADEDLLDEAAVVVKVSNNDDRSLEALIGLEHADIVIEERIEDRATRFAAIFHSDLPDVVGPIRSARTTDLDLLANLARPILVFSGANLSVLAELRSFAQDGGVVLIPDDGSGAYHYRDTDFRAPDNLFIDLAVVRDEFGADAGAPAPVFTFRGAETETRPASVDGSGVTVTGRDTVSFVHDPSRGYVRVQDGAVHVTRDGEPLVYTNVVMMETAYVPNANDPQSVDAISVGEGSVHVMIAGRRFSGTWSRDTESDPYVFRTSGGEEIVLEPGQTWISLVPRDTYEFSVDAVTQGLVLGGGE